MPNAMSHRDKIEAIAAQVGIEAHLTVKCCRNTSPWCVSVCRPAG
jgi:hypothetical protein